MPHAYTDELAKTADQPVDRGLILRNSCVKVEWNSLPAGKRALCSLEEVRSSMLAQGGGGVCLRQ